MTTVTLHNVDPRTLHHQILQLELLHRSMSPGSLDAQTIQAYGEARPLQVGMQLQADIMQERRKLYEWVLEPLLSITGKL